MAMQPTASGQYDYGVSVLNIIDEGFSRCGIQENSISAEQMMSARRSLNMMMLNRAADYVNLWTVRQVVIPLPQGALSVSLPEGAIDVLEANVRDSANPQEPQIQIDIWGRNQWMTTSMPMQESSRPTRIWVDRQLITSGVVGAPTETPVHVWQVPNNSTHELVLSVMFYPERIDSLVQGIGVPPLFLDAISAELPRRLAVKYAADRYEMLKVEEMEAVRQAKMGASENTEVVFDLGGYR